MSTSSSSISSSNNNIETCTQGERMAAKSVGTSAGMEALQIVAEHQEGEEINRLREENRKQKEALDGLHRLNQVFLPTISLLLNDQPMTQDEWKRSLTVLTNENAHFGADLVAESFRAMHHQFLVQDDKKEVRKGLQGVCLTLRAIQDIVDTSDHVLRSDKWSTIVTAKERREKAVDRFDHELAEMMELPEW
jgi:hypothetical protein